MGIRRASIFGGIVLALVLFGAVELAAPAGEARPYAPPLAVPD